MRATSSTSSLSAVDRESAFYAALIQSAAEGICVCHSIPEFPHVAFTVWNPRMTGLTGYTIAEINAHGWYQTLYADEQLRQRAIDRMSQMRKGHNLVGEAWTITRKDGQQRILSISTSVIEAGDQTVYVLALMQDITEQRQAEAHIRQLSRQVLRAQDHERRVLARELHETTGQHLSALTMWLATLKTHAAQCPPDVQQALAAATELAEVSAREVRSMSYLLYPPLLEERGLTAAVRWFVDDFQQRSNLPVTLEMCSDFGRLPAEAETALFRVLQECLNNVHRHARARHARVRLRQEADAVELEVEDDGVGMAGIPRSKWGIGLRGVQERVTGLVGTLEIDGKEGGTRVRVVLPVGGDPL